MEKLFKSMMAVAIAAFTFAACDDVPEPYNNPYNGIVIVPEVQDADPEGTGTKEDPFNVAAALAKCKEAGEIATSEEFYCKGYVTTIKSIDTNQYKNAEFKIADSKEGGTELTVYRAKGPGNTPITDENIIKLGDEVVICGKLKNYKGNTPEFDSGCYIVSINGVGGGEQTTEETIGTKEAPKTVADVLTVINGLENNKTTDEIYIVKGKVKQVITTDANITQYKNIDYLITDDGTNEIKVFRGKYLDNADFTVENKVKVDDVVIIRGKLQKYEKDGTITPEIVDNYIIDLNGEGGNPTPTPTGDNLLTNGDFETWEGSTPTNWDGKAGSATLSQSTDKHNGTYAVKIAGVTSNKRLSYKAITLKAGTYNIKFYAKGASADGATVRPGYVAIKEDGSVDSQNYKYGSYTNDIKASEWAEITHNFTLTAQTTICLVVMNPGKSDAPGVDVLIDDFELTTSDGGIADGGEGEGGGGEGGNPTPGSAEAKGDGSQANPFNALGAINYVKGLGNDVESSDNVYVKGKIATIKYTYSSNFGTAQYTISETGATTEDQFTVYGSYYMAAEQKWTEGDTQIAVGDEVLVCGKVIYYGGTTPEFANKKNWLVSITKAN